MNQPDLGELDPSLLEPINGVTLQIYGEVSARVISGHKLEDALALYNINKDVYTDATEKWNERFKLDKSFKLSQMYGQYFNQNSLGTIHDGAGANSTLEETPIEIFAELTAAQSVYYEKGKDPVDAFKSLGYTLTDFAKMGQYFSEKMMSDVSLSVKFSQLLQQYTEKYQKELQ